MRLADRHRLDALTAGWTTGVDQAQDTVVAQILADLAVIFERVDRLERDRRDARIWFQVENLLAAAVAQREAPPPAAIN